MRREQLRNENLQDGETRDTSGSDATERTIIPRLVHLADVRELEVAKGETDIRGWSVRTADGKEVGIVHDLIVDSESRKVRYLEARIDHAVLSGNNDRYALIPIESAGLDRDNSVVNLNAAIVDARSLPPSERKSVSENAASAAHDGLPVVHADDERLLAHRPHDQDENGPDSRPS